MTGVLHTSDSKLVVYLVEFTTIEVRIDTHIKLSHAFNRRYMRRSSCTCFSVKTPNFEGAPRGTFSLLCFDSSRFPSSPSSSSFSGRTAVVAMYSFTTFCTVVGNFKSLESDELDDVELARSLRR